MCSKPMLRGSPAPAEKNARQVCTYRDPLTEQEHNWRARPVQKFLGYLIAVGGIAGITYLRLQLDPIWGVKYPYILFFVPVIAAVVIGGLGPGLLSVFLSSIAASYFLIEPRRNFNIENPGDAVAWLINISLAATIVVLVQWLRRARGGAEAYAELRELQAREMQKEISARTEVEEQLRVANQRFELAATAVSGVVFDRDVKTGYVFRSYGVSSLLGYETQEIEPTLEWWLGIVHPEDKAQVAAAFDSIHERDSYEIEYRVQRVDGSYAFVWEKAAVLRDESGQPARVVGYKTDISARKRAEELLQQSEQRFRTLVGATSQIIWYTDAAGAFIQEQPGWEAFTGQTYDEYKNFGWLDAIHPEDQESVATAWKAQMGTWAVFESQHRLRNQQGEYRYMSVQAVPVLEADGRVREWVGFHTDVTERKKAEAALHESEARKRGILETALDAIVTIDHTGKIVEANPAAERLFGYAGDELVGTYFADLAITEVEREQFWQGITRFLSAGETGIVGERMENIAVRKSGEKFSAEMSIAAIETSATALFTIFVRDITTRRQAESALRRTHEDLENRVRERTAALARANEALRAEIGERRFAEDALRQSQKFVQGITDATPAILYVYDLSLDRLIYVNREVHSLLGYSQETTRKSKLFFNSNYLHPDDVAVLAERLGELKALKPGQTRQQIFRIRHSDGSWKWLQARDTVFTGGEQGTAWQLLGAAIDVTERIEAEEQIRKLNEELEQRVEDRTHELQAANEELEAFSYSVSHDLRQPLRAIDGFSAILSREYQSILPEDGLRLLKVVRQNTQQMGMLVDDLLSFSKLGRQPVQKSRVDLSSIVRDVLELLQPEHENRDVQFQLDELGVAEADPNLLKQVFLNLLGNSIKYTREKSPAIIEVRSLISETGQKVYFVKDNGVGFSMKYADKLFGVFQRLHRQEDYEGTGVGLAIVHRVVTRHGGTIWASAEPGAGAAFYFTLTQESAGQEQMVPQESDVSQD